MIVVLVCVLMCRSGGLVLSNGKCILLNPNLVWLKFRLNLNNSTSTPTATQKPSLATLAVVTISVILYLNRLTLIRQLSAGFSGFQVM
jgi:hypothetical protein